MALDDATVDRIGKLATLWGVSRSEAVRRAVAMAERKTLADRGEPLKRLAEYHRAGGLDADRAQRYLRELREARGAWRGEG